MNITSDVKDAKLTATVTIPAADVDAAIKKAYRDAAKKYRFPGFRAGHAPRPVIDNMLGAGAVLAQATNDLIGEAEPKVINELDIVPVKAGEYGELENPVADHEDFVYTIEFQLRPSCELTSYDPVEIEMPPAEVTEGEIERTDSVRVVRDGVVIFEGSFASMRRFKDDVKSVKAGYECGLGIEKYQDIKVGDILEAFKVVEVARTE